MLYKTSKDFLVRFGLKDLSELPSLEEFERLAASELQEEAAAVSEPAAGSAAGLADDGGVEQMAEDQAVAPENVTEPTVSSDPEHNQADEQEADQIASESGGG